MKKSIILGFILSVNVACGMESSLEYKCISMTIAPKTMIPTTQATLAQRITNTTLYRDFALAQSSESTIHPNLKPPQHARMTFEEVKTKWEEVADRFNKALTCYNAGNITEGDSLLKWGLFWGYDIFVYTALAKDENYMNSVATLSAQISAVQDIPGNPIQYFQEYISES